jgi:signal transduction histidine kinase
MGHTTMDGMNGIASALDIPPLRRLREAPWSVLLVPVALLVVGIFGQVIPWGVTAVLAGLATLLIPAVAADLVTAGMICIGLYACYITVWMVLAFYHVVGNAVPLATHVTPLMTHVTPLGTHAANIALYLPGIVTHASGNPPGIMMYTPGSRASIVTYLTGSPASGVIHHGTGFYASIGRIGLNPLSQGFLTGSGAGVTVDVLKSVLILGFAVWLVPRTIGVHSGLVRRNAALASRVDLLTETRVAAVDTAAAELRRLERDLHDGAQARLVALGINLRAAEQLFKTNPDAALALVAESRENSALALAELRALVRGIHPPVLADRGLADAVRALALSSPVPAQTEIQLPRRLPAPVESAAYFAVAETLANAVKHSGARTVHIRIACCAGMLRIEVTDDGHGGADPAHGTGLAGVERRVAAFDGILAVSSPPGGPTIIVIEVPCALSSPKTSSC